MYTKSESLFQAELEKAYDKTKQKKKNTSESGVSFQELLEQEIKKVDLLA